MTTQIPSRGAAVPEQHRTLRARVGRRPRHLRALRLGRSLDRHLRVVWRNENRAWRETMLAMLNDAPLGGRPVAHVRLHPLVGGTAAEVRFSDSKRIMVCHCHPPAVTELAQQVAREDVVLTHAHYAGPFYALNFSGSEGPFSLLVGKVLPDC